MKPRIAVFDGHYWVTYVTDTGVNFMSTPFDGLEDALFMLRIAYLTHAVAYSPPR